MSIHQSIFEHKTRPKQNKRRERELKKPGVELHSTQNHRSSSSSSSSSSPLMLLQLSTVHCLLEMPRFLKQLPQDGLLRD
jgi:hypothetical protein